MLKEELARKQLSEPGATCVVIGGAEPFRSEEHGIRPLMHLLLDRPDILHGAYIADKVVGKAAALLMVYGQVGGVYAAVISEQAIGVFETYAVPFRFGERKAYIQNRDRTGICPMEQKALNCKTPDEAFVLFRTFFRRT